MIGYRNEFEDFLLKGNNMYTAYLVDDEELILDEFIRTIPWMDNGFEVIGYNTSPQKAIAEIESIHPDVVFCDLKMIGMDGNELIKKLKEDGISSEFVMVSAFDSFENVRTFFQQSGFDYVLKPVNQDDIQLVLERLVQRLAAKQNQSSVPCTTGIVPDEAEADDSPELPTNNLSVNKMLAFIDINFSKKITLDILSKQFGFSRNYICNLFSKYFHTSLTCYLTAKRMEHAKKLLADKSLLLKDIAIECGYSEYVQFYKVFKDYYGVSPKEMLDSI